jgi:hypothetical protein
MTYRVNTEGLNLRSEPVVRPGTILVVLRYGDTVERVADIGNEWWEVRARLDSLEVDGYVASRFLSRADGYVPPEPVAGSIPAVHMPTTRSHGERQRPDRRAYPLLEASQPTRDPNGLREGASLTRIVDWLDVENSPRYVPGASTYCNIYAYDYAYLANAYLPRVWWTDTAIAALKLGDDVAPIYGRTLRELGANSLYEWLAQYGRDYGWVFTLDLTELQSRANLGHVALICARNKDRNRSGHIATVVPETGKETAQWQGATTTQPLQSQAGRRNYRYRTFNWWWSAQFDGYGYWYAQ